MLTCRARKRCYQNQSQQRGRKYISVRTANFFSLKRASNCFPVIDPAQVKIAPGLIWSFVFTGKNFLPEV